MNSTLSIHSQLPVLNKLLSAGDVGVRIAVGQAVALLFELAEDEEDEPVSTYFLWGRK